MIVVPRWSANVLESLQWKGQLNAPHLAELVENRSGIIAVTEDGTVFGNGMYDGQFNTDLKRDTNGIVRPYALSLFHPAPREVLVIGLASGSWSQVIANNSEVASVTIVEINSGYKTLIAKEPEVASLLTNPKVTLVTDDGRRWLRANPNRRFDAIVANATYHFRANATNLLSAEFLNLIKGHLNVGESSSITPPVPTASNAPAASRSLTAHVSQITCWSQTCRSAGTLLAGGAYSNPTRSTAGRHSTRRPAQTVPSLTV